MRLFISTINTPTRFLEQNSKIILKNSLTKSNYIVKNSWKFQNNIVKKTIPDDDLIVSLDVVPVFQNIPLELDKKAVVDG